MKHLFLILLVTGLIQPAFAQEETEVDEPARWTPERSMQFKNIDAPAISPDGEWIAYTVREPVMTEEKSEYLTQVFMVRTDGTGARQFTRGEKSSDSPQFSPDGSHLTFTSNRSDENQIWIIPVDGGEARQLTEAENDVAAYQWSPDGTMIAYTMREPDTEEEEKAKKEKSWIIREDQNFKFNHLHVVQIEDFEAGVSKQVTAGDFTVTSFDWSPDGSRLLFSHAANTNINEMVKDQDISWVPSDSGAVTALVAQPGVDSNPKYSHDGTQIAFQSQGGRMERVGLNDFYVMRADGSGQRPLAQTPDRMSNFIGWTQGDGHLLFAEAYHTTIQIFTLSTDGDASQPVRWSEQDVVIGAVALNTAGDMITFTLQSPDKPENLFVSGIGEYDPVQLTDIHTDVEMPPMGRTELVAWKSTDGLDIEGLLTYPVDYQPGTKVPLVLQIHGGPAGVFVQSFTGGPSIYMTQVFAQRGYAVLRPNPRGSSGYGKEFRYANVMDWGYGDWDDVESGVDAVIDMGVAHPDSLLLMGWSYGGYMTSFGVTRTNRFKAASMGAGLPNLISMVTTTDIPDYLAAHMGGEYFNDYETYEKHSAIYRIKNVTTPTQVIHGENDVRVPTDQGREFYVSLKRLGVPTEMLILPRTPHGPREPRLLMGVTPSILEWFEKHLKRKPLEAEPGS